MEVGFLKIETRIVKKHFVELGSLGRKVELFRKLDKEVELYSVIFN
jgi:hypothetical protein